MVVTTLGYGTFLLGPPLVGGLAELVGLRLLRSGPLPSSTPIRHGPRAVPEGRRGGLRSRAREHRAERYGKLGCKREHERKQAQGRLSSVRKH